MPPMEEDVTDPLAAQAVAEALAAQPRFSAFGPRVVRARLRQGTALMVRYAQDPPKGDADAWEFQNTVVKRYRALGGS